MVGNFDVYLSNATFVNTIFVDGDVGNTSCSLYSMNLDDVRGGQVTCVPRDGCDLLCFEDDLNFERANRSRRAMNSTANQIVDDDSRKDVIGGKDGKVKVKNLQSTDDGYEPSISFYKSASFWAFVILMCVGTVAFNVANCIGDAVCFDVLGKIVL